MTFDIYHTVQTYPVQFAVEFGESTSGMYYPGQGQDSLWPTKLPPYVAAVLFETLLYGIYLVLFGTCMFLLVRRGRNSHWVLFVSSSFMFAMATADIIYTWYLLFVKVLGPGLAYSDLRPRYLLYVTTNFVADALLMYRFYMVWYSNPYVVICPAILLLLATACGYTLEGVSFHLSKYSWAYLTINLVLNVTITSLVVGRIWWVGNAARRQLNKDMTQRYKTAISIFIESGVIYSVYISLDLGFRRVPAAFAVLDSGLIQIVGIVPTLILVQSGLTNGIQSSESTMVTSASNCEAV